MIIHYLYDYITITDPYRYMNILNYMLADEKQYAGIHRTQKSGREKWGEESDRISNLGLGLKRDTSEGDETIDKKKHPTAGER